MSKEFYELCFNQYELEMKEAEGIYQRAGVMLIVIPILSAVVIKVGRIDILNQLFTRVDIFIYYFTTLSAIVALAISVVCLFLCIYPCKYKTLANMNFWKEWRDEYQGYLKRKNNQADSSNEDELDIATFENIRQKIIEAQPVNAEINEKRSKAFKRSMLMAVIALAAIVLQATFYLILKIQGV